MAGAVIARSAELAALDAFLAGIGSGLAGLAFEGEAGIGKSTLWLEGVRRARTLGARVLEARPAETEAGYSFATLADLLGSVSDDVVSRLAAPQRQAVQTTLLRAEAPLGGVDERVVCAGVLSLLRALAREGFLVIAVDDAQWVDTPSARVLEFAIRRMQDEPVVVIATVRPSGAPVTTFDERALPPGRRQVVAVGPLSVAALHELFVLQLGHSFARPTLTRIADASAGNPLYALEIARELERRPPAGSSLPVPVGLSALVEARVGRLPAATRRALLVAASLWRPTVDLVDAAALGPAEDAGIVRIERAQVRFSHPLYASAVYRLAGARARRSVHSRLAAKVSDPEERARHLALACTGPDAAVAQALEEAAGYAGARGASSAAAELLELALELTPSAETSAALRREIQLAQRLAEAGDPVRAEELLRRTLETAPTGRARSEATAQLARLVMEAGDWEPGVRLLEAALAEAPDRAGEGGIHAALADAYRLDVPRAIEHARRALDLLDPGEDPGAYSRALQIWVEARLLAGEGADHEAMRRSLALQEQATGWSLSQLAGGWARGFDDFETARERFRRLIRLYEERGLEAELPSALAHLATVELWTGHPELAEKLAREAGELAEQVESAVSACIARYALGLVLAHRGALDEARRTANATLEVFSDRPAPILETQARAVLGFVELSAGDPDAAVGHFARADELLAAIGWREPFHFRYHGDQLEALAQLGRIEEAETLVESLEASARRVSRPWISAVAARGRGLVLAGRDDLDGALESLERALAAHEALEMPFERARTLLVLGQIQRRRKQKRLARVALDESLRAFEALGAPVWAERAQVELARTQTRRAAHGLSPTEREIALLAADGLTNKAIAERVFVSQKTVEANLARVYRKLGITSRAQLGRAVEKLGDRPIS